MSLRRFQLLDRVRRRLRGPVADMSMDAIRQARGPHVPTGGVAERLSWRVVGRPRPDVRRSWVHVPGAEQPQRARRHDPPVRAPAAPVVLHLHGGGWVVGGPTQYDWFCGELAHALGAVVVSVDYRKAPEHPAPAATEDAVAAARWLLDGPGPDGLTGPVLVAGDSAGGNLAALVAIAARDEGWARLVGQLLVYPATDLTMTTRSATTQTTEPILHRTDMEAFVGMYLADRVEPTDPRVSPLHVADVGGVAPACVQTAERDPLRDEGRAYARHLEAAGVPTRLTEYVGVPHGFVSLPGLTSAAAQAVAELVQFARPLVAPGRAG